MYYLDFITIVRLLKEFRRSGILRSELPGGVVNTQETCWLHLKLIQGEIINFYVITNHGEMVVADQNLLHQVEGLGPLEWTFGPLKKPSTPLIKPSDIAEYRSLSNHLPAISLNTSSHLSSSLFVLVPRRLLVVERQPLSTLTRQQRRVLALVDGKRNVSQIAALLFHSANSKNGTQETLTLLLDLEVLRIIILQ